MSPARRIPRATYRVQLTPEQDLDAVAGLVDQLAELGISHLYLSPALEAVPGSRHGYDVVDPTRFRAELGGEAALERLRAAAHGAGLGLVLDIVPNHVGLASPHNPWWWSVLAEGPDSPYAGHFDLHWRPGPHGQPTILLAELGRELSEEVAGDDLHVAWLAAGPRHGWHVVYHEHAWPLRAGSLAAVGLDPERVEATAATVNADPGLLEALLTRQHYRLAFWRHANEELDHRRFFAIKELGGLRTSDPAVFADVHAAVLPRVADGTLDGLRIDHPDGLRDPVGYLEQLRAAVGEQPWLIVEKILERGEPYRRDWPVDGTVGYEFADLVLGLHVRPEAGPVLDDLQATLTGGPIDRVAVDDASRRHVLDELFGAELRRTTAQLTEVLDLPEADARRLLVEVLTAWPVYRTYVRPDRGVVAEEDRDVIERAVARVRARQPGLPGLDALRAVLLLEERPVEPAARAAADEVVWSLQQLTGPVVAKGVEDTALYRDLRFVAVNEVGGDPGHLGRDLGEVHAAHAAAQHDRPATMLLSSSHDTKRSGDVRARLAVLSQDPDHWVRTVLRWRELAARHRGRLGPTPAHEHLAFQTLVGAWPLDADRLEAYLLKAAREGARVTGHLDPDPDYEAELATYVRGLLADADVVADVERVVGEVREAGWLTSLSMTLVKATAPGVPDVYQGDELWDLSLVDPDNRRPVDHARRRRLLAELREEPDPATLLARLDEGLPKLWVLQRALHLRAQRPDAFGASAGYRPILATGRRDRHVLAFARSESVVTVAPTEVRRLGPVARWDWGDTALELPPGTWRDVLTDRVVPGGHVGVGDLLADFPVALLARTEP